MASALGTASTAPAAAAPKSSAHLPLSNRIHSRVSFRVSPKPKLRFCSSSKGQSSWNHSALVRAQSNEVAVDGSSTAAVNAPSKSTDVKDLKLSNGPAPVATQESITEFMGQVAGLVKLVDSRDIAELQLKQLNCELVIRKKEALPPPPSPTPYMMAPSPYAPSHYAPPPAPVAAAPAPTPALAAAPPAAAPVANSPPKSSLPPLKSPMAGTFYRSPGPGEPPFVKVGDKVTKGQVICIIEAMKLMNEIEADQAGTVIDVVAEDGKPISIDTPLFVIQP